MTQRKWQTAGDALRPGDKFTIPGCGWGSRGQEVYYDYNPKTKRKCKCVRLRVYTVQQGVSDGI